MNHPYLPHTQDDIREMLDQIGLKTLEELFSDIDSSIRLTDGLNLPSAQSEAQIIQSLKQISEKNIDVNKWTNYAGGGLYEHGVPSIVANLISRSEFATAYTPYQPEISQGTLQGIFEYQTMICELTGLDVSNASHYDGSTALAEAAFMACSATRKNQVLISSTLNPIYKNVLKTYLTYKDLDYEEIDISKYFDDLGPKEKISSACLITQSPNYYGVVEDYTGISQRLHQDKSLFIQVANPLSLALHKSPSEWGVDIAVGEGQVFGNTLNFGGPSLGYMACTKKLMRKMPGRIVGETLDIDGNRGYVLTLQGREQHIRREKATSNITSNQALNAVAATIHLSTLGYKGIYEVARRSRGNAYYLREALSKIQGVKVNLDEAIFNEFVVEISSVQDFFEKMKQYQIVPGIIIDSNKNQLLVSTTEVLKKRDLDAFIDAVKEVL
jgi:glycine dehydrogenase subunit 1